MAFQHKNTSFEIFILADNKDNAKKKIIQRCILQHKELFDLSTGGDCYYNHSNAVYKDPIDISTKNKLLNYLEESIDDDSMECYMECYDELHEEFVDMYTF